MICLAAQPDGDSTYWNQNEVSYMLVCLAEDLMLGYYNYD